MLVYRFSIFTYFTSTFMLLTNSKASDTCFSKCEGRLPAKLRKKKEQPDVTPLFTL